MHYRILYNPSVEVTVKARFLEEFMQIRYLRMSTSVNDSMVYRANPGEPGIRDRESLSQTNK